MEELVKKVEETKLNPDVDVEDKRLLARTLYSSEKKFTDLGLRKELIDGAYGINFNQPTKIQGEAIPLILKDPPKNFLGQAQSGTGKTGTFLLCALQRVNENLKHPQALILAPTRELVRQIYDVAKSLAKFTKIDIALVIPGAEFPGELTHQIIIGTPGRVQTLTSLKEKKKLNLSKLILFILDEADHMVGGQGMQEQSQKIFSLVPQNCQVCLFSATYGEQEKAFADKIFKSKPEEILIKPEQLSLDKLGQYKIDCGSEAGKFDVLDEIYRTLNVGQSIIFVHTIKKAKELKARMEAKGHEISLIHGQDMPLEVRDEVIDRFRNGLNRVLISTNVLARGLDVLTVQLVINYDLPMDGNLNIEPETYLHRIGRTSRYDNPGLAINFIHDEKSRRDIEFISTKWKKDIKSIPRDNIGMIKTILEEMGAAV